MGESRKKSGILIGENAGVIRYRFRSNCLTNQKWRKYEELIQQLWSSISGEPIIWWTKGNQVWFSPQEMAYHCHIISKTLIWPKSRDCLPMERRRLNTKNAQIWLMITESMGINKVKHMTIHGLRLQAGSLPFFLKGCQGAREPQVLSTVVSGVAVDSACSYLWVPVLAQWFAFSCKKTYNHCRTRKWRMWTSVLVNSSGYDLVMALHRGISTVHFNGFHMEICRGSYNYGHPSHLKSMSGILPPLWCQHRGDHPWSYGI